jgi:regulator of nucleoside diphosphate kinase
MNTVTLERTLGELDHIRLSNLIQREPARSLAEAHGIADVLDAAEIIPSREVGADVVTMHSQVLLREPGMAEPTRLTLCYPADSDPAKGLVSVLSPVGTSLLGLHVGSTARWRTPDGEQHAAEVAAVLFQPEADGDYTT